MTTLAQLDTIFGSDVTGLLRGLVAANSAVGKFETDTSASAKRAGASFALLGTAAGAFAVGAAASLALPFEDAFTRIDALSNASASSIEDWRGEVIKLAGETAQAPQKLAEALFFLSSAGLETEQVMQALDASAKASAVGLGETGDIARLTATVLNAYADSGITATQVTDTLVAAVREGTADTDEFNDAIGRILPIASKAGVGFDQIVGSLAGLSNIGLDVNEGVTAMRGLLQALVAPGSQAAQALGEVGISTEEMRAAIADQGLLGALQLLQERTGGNIDLLRQIVPNVRALTGELGLTGENAEKVAAIFDATAHSAGSLNQALADTQKGPGFQFRKALNDVVVIGTQLGQQVLPTLVDFAKLLAPALKVAAAGARALLGAFLAYKAVKFLPTLFGAIATAAKGVGFQSAAFSSAGLAVGMEGVAAAAGPLAAGVGLAVISLQGLINAGRETEAQIDTLIERLRAGEISYIQLRDGVVAAEVGTGKFAGRLPKVTSEAKESAEAALETAYAIGRMGMAEGQAAALADRLAFSHDEAGRQVRNFAGLSDEAFKEFKSSVVESTRVAIGQFSKVGDAFSTTPAELRKQLRVALRVAQGFQRDLREIMSDPKLSDAQKRALAQLEPEQRRAFSKLGESARRQFAQDAVKLQRLNERSLNQITRAGSRAADGGGREVGSALVDGMTGAINDRAHNVADAAAKMVRDAIAAAKRAARSESPSKETAKLGADLVAGVILGIQRGLPALERTVDTMVQRIKDHMSGLADIEDLSESAREALRIADQAALDQLRSFGSDVGELTRRFERLNDQIGEFRDAIRSGFDQFDLIGGAIELLSEFTDQMAEFEAGNLEVAPTAPDFGAFAAQQAAQAQELADVLTQLSAQGLNQQLLQQIAAQGPAGVAFGRELLSDPSLIAAFNQAQADIAAALGQTTEQLVSDQFGKQIADLEHDVSQLVKALRKFLRGLDEDAAGNLEKIIKRLRRILEDLGGGGDAGGAAPPPPSFAGGKPPTPPPAGGETITIVLDSGELVAYVDEGLSKRGRVQGRLAHKH